MSKNLNTTVRLTPIEWAMLAALAIVLTFQIAKWYFA